MERYSVALKKDTWDSFKTQVNEIADTENSYFFETGMEKPSVERFSENGFAQAGMKFVFPARFLTALQSEGHSNLANEILHTRMDDFFNSHTRKESFLNADGKTKTETMPDKVLFREFGKDGKIHAVLSSKYAIFDDKEVINIMETSDYLMNSEEIWGHVSPDRLHLRFISKNKLNISGDDSPLSMAVFVDNSMVGKSSLKIRFGIYRWACTNGCISGLKEFNILKERHMGEKDFTGVLSQALLESEKYEEMLFDKVREMSETSSSIYDMSQEDAIRYIKEKLTVGKKTADKIIELYNGYGGVSKWHLCNAITDYAHGLNIDDRLRFESLSMKVA